MDEESKKYYILKSMIEILQEILVEHDFSLVEISKIMRSLILDKKNRENNIKPEELIFFDLMRLSEEFREKFNLDMNIVFPKK